MGFIHSYKHLEKLCGEIMRDERRVSAYIDEMLRLPSGSYLVKGWNDDLRQLKHYRWVRNQIVHNPNCSEETMCNEYDVQWIDNFHSRIMNQTDPLALYRKAIEKQSYANQTPRKSALPVYPSETFTNYEVTPNTHKNIPEDSNNHIGIFIFIIIAFVLFVILSLTNI